jgi:hypothetical protein
MKLVVGNTDNGYLIDTEKQELVIYQLHSVYEKVVKKLKGNIEIAFSDIAAIEITYSSYDASIWGVNCALVLIATTKLGEKISFHGAIEASKEKTIEALELLQKENIKIIDSFGLLHQLKNSNKDRVDYIIQDYSKNM